MKKKQTIIRGIELAYEEQRLQKNLLPADIDRDSLPRGYSPYFEQYGFKVANALSALYSLYNG